MDPIAITELVPDWKSEGAPLETPVTEDRFLFLTETGSRKVPDWMLPACFKNHGNYVVSLSDVAKWLGAKAEAVGVEIYPGLPAAEVLYDEKGAVRGVATGIDADGRLCLSTDKGPYAVAAGDVVHVR